MRNPLFPALGAILLAACSSVPASPAPEAAAVLPVEMPAFRLSGFQSRLAGKPTEVLVLGSPHLSGAPDDFDPAVLEPLLERLAAFGPDLIAIENLAGESLTALQSYSSIYGETASDFGGRFLKGAAMAKAETGLDMPAAEAEVRRTLADWPAEPNAAARRHLAALFLASGDPQSALVQWWRLPEEEQHAGDGISEELVAYLRQYDTRKNESHQIASRLGARLGLERVYPTDDQTGVDIMYAFEEEIGALYSTDEFQALLAAPENDRIRNAAQHLTTPDEALETYRFLNSPEAALQDAELQWVWLIENQTPNDVGRVRLAEWEARNLRQVAHIREAMASVPGGRVLVIVGSSHKPWFDAYLGQMLDVKIVDAEEVLR
jgi:hypothetical protein